MHELGVASSVITAVHQAAGGRAVHTVEMTVGSRSGVVIDALYGAWPLARVGTCCATAELVITEIPAAVYCPQCAGPQEIDEFFALTCPQCGTPTAHLVAGTECRVDAIEIADATD